MTGAPARLPVATGPAFGTAIDRDAPLSFRLDGMSIAAFAGDSVLSAVLANGIDASGGDRRALLGLDARSCPSVRIAGDDRPDGALPMDRVPAIDGLDLVTSGARPARWMPTALMRSVRRAMGRVIDLGLDGLGGDDARPGWLASSSDEQMDADLLVVGGGVAGLSAALRGAKLHKRVILVERRLWLGGDAPYFGRYGDEEAPEALVARLSAAAMEHASITVLTGAEVLALFSGEARLLLADTSGAAPRGRLLRIVAPRCVLATGGIERLPVFSGNRLPGVRGSVGAYHLAARQAVWSGHTAVLATSSNPSYRMAMRLADAGIGFRRIIDNRARPQSRFIDFAKATGVTQTTGARVISVSRRRREGRLAIALGGTAGYGDAARQLIHADTLLVSGGWQPDLTLWLQAGGASRWNAEHATLTASGRVPNLALAGAAAGYLSNATCLQSGENAVLELFDRSVMALHEVPADAAFETPDAPPPVAPAESEGSGAAYLDAGRSLAVHAPAARLAATSWRKRRALLSGPSGALEVGDVVAGVLAGMIPPEDAGAVAEERCTFGGSLPIAVTPFPAKTGAPAPGVPDYLAGRFGGSPARWTIAAEDSRTFAEGSLLYPNSDAGRPDSAIGVVIRPLADGAGQAEVLLGPGRSAGDWIFVREATNAVAVRLVSRLDGIGAAPADPQPAPAPSAGIAPDAGQPAAGV